MWISHPQKNNNYNNFGFSQGADYPLFSLTPNWSNPFGGFFMSGLRTGSRKADSPVSLTLARLGHGNGPLRKDTPEPLRSASAPAAQSEYTSKSSIMELGKESRFK